MLFTKTRVEITRSHIWVIQMINKKFYLNLANVVNLAVAFCLMICEFES